MNTDLLVQVAQLYYLENMIEIMQLLQYILVLVGQSRKIGLKCFIVCIRCGLKRMDLS